MSLENQRFPLSRFAISYAAYEHSTGSSPSQRLVLVLDFAASLLRSRVLAAERGMQERHCNTRASRPSRELAVPLCWTSSVLLPDCAESTHSLLTAASATSLPPGPLHHAKGASFS